VPAPLSSKRFLNAHLHSMRPVDGLYEKGGQRENDENGEGEKAEKEKRKAALIPSARDLVWSGLLEAVIVLMSQSMSCARRSTELVAGWGGVLLNESQCPLLCCCLPTDGSSPSRNPLGALLPSGELCMSIRRG
jgi:hypothetical protein